MVSARIFMNFTRFLEARNRVGTWIGSSLIRRQCALDRARYALFSANSAFSVCNAHTRYLVCMSTRCRTHELQIKPNQVTALRILRRNLHVSCARGAGHNKWSKIKRHKAVTDLEKSKLRGKLLDQIRAAVASGGNDTSTNIKLSSLLSQAKSSRVPKSNIEAALKHSSLGDTACESVLYEGRGPSGYLVLIDALTDNRNRTRPEIRQIIEKQGGILGEPGSSAFMFEQKAIIQLSSESTQQLSSQGLDPMELAIEVGAEDINIQNDKETSHEIIQLKSEPAELTIVCTALRDRGFDVSSATVEYLPKSLVGLKQEQFKKAEKMVELLGEQSDVVAVYSNHQELE